MGTSALRALEISSLQSIQCAGMMRAGLESALPGSLHTFPTLDTHWVGGGSLVRCVPVVRCLGSGL